MSRQEIDEKNSSDELIIANKELVFQNEEKEKRAAELIIANTELAFQNKEKEKRAAELSVANIELAFQNQEKEKRAAELVIANKELTFQNQEKEKRAAELSLANIELLFQNKEKEKRAAELSIANTELAFQNKEKEKRAAELGIANIELAFQNQEKEKRAEELSIANKELKKAEKKILTALKESTDYKDALDQSCIVAITDNKGIIKYVNNNFCSISKYSREELIGHDHRIINSGYHPKEFIKNIWTTIAKGKVWNGEIKNKAKDGTFYWVDTTIVPFLDEKGKPFQYLAIRDDITERKKAETAIRNFSKHLNQVQEEERAHISREIHDELGQYLASARMRVSTLLKQKINIAEPASEIVNDIDNAMRSMRKIATELRPAILDTLGLIPSIEWLTEEFEKRTGIKCEKKIKVEEQKFEKNISTCFFRICQESMTNITKYAEANKVTISILQNKKELIMKIADNGKGISDEKLKNPFSMGLLGMQERANNIGGDLQITSKKNEGTTIQLKATLN